MDTNTIDALIRALAASKLPVIVPAVVAPASNSVQIITLILAAIAPVLSALAIYLVRMAMTEVVELKTEVNGKMGELLKAKTAAAYSNGMSEQRATAAMIEAAHAKGAAEQLKEINSPSIAAQVERQVEKQVAKAIEKTEKPPSIL